MLSVVQHPEISQRSVACDDECDVPNMRILSLEPKSMEFDQVGTLYRQRGIVGSGRSDTQVVSLDHEDAVLSSRDAENEHVRELVPSHFN